MRESAPPAHRSERISLLGGSPVSGELGLKMEKKLDCCSWPHSCDRIHFKLRNECATRGSMTWSKVARSILITCRYRRGIADQKPHGQNNTDRGYPLPATRFSFLRLCRNHLGLGRGNLDGLIVG